LQEIWPCRAKLFKKYFNFNADYQLITEACLILSIKLLANRNQARTFAVRL